jgi:hypothetical protein
MGSEEWIYWELLQGKVLDLSALNFRITQGAF